MKNKKENINFLAVYEWMLKLGLGPGPLVLYANIYSYTTNNKDFFYTLGTISKKFNISEKTAGRYLTELTKRGLIYKRKVSKNDGGSKCIYNANLEYANKIIKNIEDN